MKQKDVLEWVKNTWFAWLGLFQVMAKFFRGYKSICSWLEMSRNCTGLGKAERWTSSAKFWGKCSPFEWMRERLWKCGLQGCRNCLSGANERQVSISRIKREGGWCCIGLVCLKNRKRLSWQGPSREFVSASLRSCYPDFVAEKKGGGRRRWGVPCGWPWAWGRNLVHRIPGCPWSPGGTPAWWWCGRRWTSGRGCSGSIGSILKGEASIAAQPTICQGQGGQGGGGAQG